MHHKAEKRQHLMIQKIFFLNQHLSRSQIDKNFQILFLLTAFSRVRSGIYKHSSNYNVYG